MLKSWDIFDTLIARRCIFPHGIFFLMEKSSKVQGFAQTRILAERIVAGRGVNYTLDDIYNEFRHITNFSEQLCNNLKRLEIDTEIEQSIPIIENLRQVKSGDILISDMYLPEKVIRKMLDKAGLLVPVELVVTSGGKSSGRIWKQLAEQNQFIFHIGDNLEVDVKNPVNYGFESSISVLSQTTNPIEKWLLNRDLNFAMYLREIRLKNPFTEEIKRNYWNLFTMNLGILISLVQLIHKLQKNQGFEYLGFCGRDTYYLWLLYKKYLEQLNEEFPTDYLYYSRKLVHKSRKNIAEYFMSKIAGRKALMIDLAGTGLHLHTLREYMATDYSILICLRNIDIIHNKKYYSTNNWPEEWIAFDGNNKINSRCSNYDFKIFRSSDSNRLFVVMENLNRATHNSPIRLNNLQIGEKIIPTVIFHEVNDKENFDVMEIFLRTVLTSPIVWGGGAGLLGVA